MRQSTRSAAAVLALGLSAAPLAGTSHAQEIPSAGGCLTTFATTPYTVPGGTVTIGPYIIVDPRPAQSVVTQVGNSTTTLVNCLV